MLIRREGRLRNSDISTGDTLSLELYETDFEELAARRYTMARFLQFKHRNLGWAAEDKVHVRLEKPRDEKLDRVANLQLDPGGDLYFTIWDDERLKNAAGVEVFDDLSEFVTSDPSEKLQHLGVQTVRIYQLNFLWPHLHPPPRLLSPF